MTLISPLNKHQKQDYCGFYLFVASFFQEVQMDKHVKKDNII
jgi:hypothetical protein